MAPELEATLAAVTAAAIAFVLTPLSARFARRVGAVAEVGERSLHVAATPSMGGLAIFAGVAAAALIWVTRGGELPAILAGAALITAIGSIDDIFDLHPTTKFAGQLAAAAIPVASGVSVDHITLPIAGAVDLGASGPPLTALGFVVAMNVVNFTDGVDGLAAGVCTIAAASFAAIALSLDRVETGVLAACVAGAALGFLWHNFHPASVFMGDAGSNLLGYLLACVAVLGVLKTAAVVALAFPLVVLAVPILDTGFVIAKRIKYGHPVYRADRWHFHHRFVNIGFSQRRTVAYLYAWTSALAAFALGLRFIPYSDGHGDFDPMWTALVIALGLVAVAASVYLVLVLEILKLKRFRAWQMRRDPAGDGGEPSEHDIDSDVAERLSTGEFPALRGH